MTPRKRFYTEVLATIVAFIAAAMWIEWIKGFIGRHFAGKPSVVLAVAILMTLITVFILQFIFVEKPTEKFEQVTSCNEVTNADQSRTYVNDVYDR